MGSRRFVWLISLPLAAVGWLGTHSLAYVLVEPDADERGHLLSEAGHGYFAAAPLLVACAVTLLFAGLALAVHDGLRGAERASVPVWPVALLPPLGFAVQEYLERLFELNAFQLGTALEPTFLAGMALQLPFAVGALVLARAVLALGHALGQGLAVRRLPRPSAYSLPPFVQSWFEAELARPPILATGHGERAPPPRAIR
jgi:hypothetical protein